MKCIIKYLAIASVLLFVISCEREFKIKGFNITPRAFIEFIPCGDDSSMMKVCVAYPSQMMIEDPNLSSCVNDPASCVSILVDGIYVEARNDSKSLAFVHRKFSPGENVTVDVDLGNGCTATSKTVIPPAIKDYRIVRRGNEVLLDYYADVYPQYMSILPSYKTIRQIIDQDGATTTRVEISGASQDIFRNSEKAITGERVAVYHGIRYGRGSIFYWSDADAEVLVNGWHRMHFRIGTGECFVGEWEYDVESLQVHVKVNYEMKFQICGIHEDLYRYMDNKLSILDNSYGIFNLAPGTLNWTNVQGGFGVVAGMSTLSTGWFTLETVKN